jgi:hypothetical protein
VTDGQNGHHHVGPRRLHRRGGAAVRGGSQRPSRPARVGNARTVTPAPRSPSPAAMSWRSRARLKDARRGLQLATASTHLSKPGRGVARRREPAHHVADLAGAVTARGQARGRLVRRRRRRKQVAGADQAVERILANRAMSCGRRPTTPREREPTEPRPGAPPSPPVCSIAALAQMRSSASQSRWPHSHRRRSRTLNDDAATSRQLRSRQC